MKPGFICANSSSSDKAVRKATEFTVYQETQFIIVVEDDTAVARDAEILEQHIAGENIAVSQVLDRTRHNQ